MNFAFEKRTPKLESHHPSAGNIPGDLTHLTKGDNPISLGNSQRKGENARPDGRLLRALVYRSTSSKICFRFFNKRNFTAISQYLANMFACIKPLAVLLCLTSRFSTLAAPQLNIRAISSPAEKENRALDPSIIETRNDDSYLRNALSPKIFTRNLVARSAGLLWGPVNVGNLKLSLTNPHEGYAGPKFPNANHVNFHVDRQDPGPRGTYTAVVNMHIVKYSRSGLGGGGGSWKREQLAKRDGELCLYAWDSVTDTVVYDNCFDDDIMDAIGEAVGAIKDFVDELLRNADTIAYLVIIAALTAALIAAISSLAVVAVA
ncbi:uncharacterized protein KY384_002043 [Bacidia gigantensis]|uniref:uncharacterized protein n=1 Tax=Bacidia gigantensis TaxID=2732470 RepID=UPI001D044165|nr:uncharacterized protein KY384_002043 [Bacidia gigantensis]KAG8533260.1 hypothetical protein KY384_002043 [Bacidia gigantensis]